MIRKCTYSYPIGKVLVLGTYFLYSYVHRYIAMYLLLTLPTYHSHRLSFRKICARSASFDQKNARESSKKSPFLRLCHENLAKFHPTYFDTTLFTSICPFSKKGRQLSYTEFMYVVHTYLSTYVYSIHIGIYVPTCVRYAVVATAEC